ncbi:MAG: 50S ribosomal protein L22 [Candidatus Omnitrophica bacterium]|nr:50S ribosomal protein L22 [Candidatus Omnitrophota bacterium]
MVAKALARYIRISPRKTRLVANYVKGKRVGEALALLTNLNKRPCEFIEELLRSAISNAKRNPDIKEEELFISKLNVDGGPTLKRYRAGSMGRAMMIVHRTSHISIELDLISKPKSQISKEAGKETIGKKIRGRVFKKKTGRSK